MARADSFRVAGRAYSLVGGVTLDPDTARPRGTGARASRSRSSFRRSLAAGTDSLRVADAFSAAGGGRAGDRAAPRAATARVVITQSLAPLEALRRSVDAWFLGALAATAAAALLAALWLSSRVSRPLRDLAEKTSRLDLDRLDVGFGSERSDEIGTLARLLDAMAGRLRQSSVRLREAERRATVGDLARQVNHDVRNGLVPIRHVLTHFGEVAEREPAELARVFTERRPTLESSVAYLETLARNYARLSPQSEAGVCDVNAADAPGGRRRGRPAEVRLELAPELPDRARRPARRAPGPGEPDPERGRGARRATRPAASPSRPRTRGDGRVQVTVADTGRGMSQAELDRAFEGFYTTKPGGTGLGLTIVRRLVQDVGGSMRVETEPGVGSRFIVELPSRV